MAHPIGRGAAMLGGVAVGAGLAARSLAGRRARRDVARHARQVMRHARHLAGRWQGVAYRIEGGHPDRAVAGAVLADRIRSRLGPLEARLDVPRVHVMCEGRVALLHGEVASAAQAEKLEAAVAAVPGVAGVRSFLHVGLVPGDSRPSEGGRGRPPSPALGRLRDAALLAGAEEGHAVSAVRAVLTAFCGQLPDGERRHLMAHLPADVRILVEPAPGTRPPPHGRRVGDLVVSVVGTTEGVPLGRAEHVIESVLGTLRELVPEEARDVSAALPSELRRFWDAAVPG